MAEHGYWMNTDETVWNAKEIDGKQQLEISIVSARCSVCDRWAEQINQMPPYMHYNFCPHCGAVMDAKPPKRLEKTESHESESMPKQKISNGDRIRQKISTMKDEELQKEFADYICKHVRGDVCHRAPYCYECLMEWLKQEAKDDAEAKG